MWPCMPWLDQYRDWQRRGSYLAGARESTEPAMKRLLQDWSRKGQDPKSAEGAKEPEPTAQAVGTAKDKAKAPQGRHRRKRVVEGYVSPLRGSIGSNRTTHGLRRGPEALSRLRRFSEAGTTNSGTSRPCSRFPFGVSCFLPRSGLVQRASHGRWLKSQTRRCERTCGVGTDRPSLGRSLPLAAQKTGAIRAPCSSSRVRVALRKSTHYRNDPLATARGTELPPAECLAQIASGMNSRQQNVSFRSRPARMSPSDRVRHAAMRASAGSVPRAVASGSLLRSTNQDLNRLRSSRLRPQARRRR